MTMFRNNYKWCKMNRLLVKTIIDWFLLALTIGYLLTGLGITHYRIIESLTGGLLSKNLSFFIPPEMFSYDLT